ncbi:unnamed protein product, partial [Brassica oleracea var. botrytis]
VKVVSSILRISTRTGLKSQNGSSLSFSLISTSRHCLDQDISCRSRKLTGISKNIMNNANVKFIKVMERLDTHTVDVDVKFILPDCCWWWTSLHS